MHEVKRIVAGLHRRYKRTPEQFEETELDIPLTLEAHGNSNMKKYVKRLVAAGATRVTMRANPDADLKNPYAEDADIYTGYAD